MELLTLLRWNWNRFKASPSIRSACFDPAALLLVLPLPLRHKLTLLMLLVVLLH